MNFWSSQQQQSKEEDNPQIAESQTDSNSFDEIPLPPGLFAMGSLSTSLPSTEDSHQLGRSVGISPCSSPVSSPDCSPASSPHVTRRGKNKKGLSSPMAKKKLLFQCSIPGCHTALTTKANKKRHEQLHTGEKPFGCPFCNKPFARKYDCEVHQRVHTKEKPYSCPECFKSFTRASTLREHQRNLHSKRASQGSPRNDRKQPPENQGQGMESTLSLPDAGGLQANATESQGQLMEQALNLPNADGLQANVTENQGQLMEQALNLPDADGLQANATENQGQPMEQALNLPSTVSFQENWDQEMIWMALAGHTMWMPNSSETHSENEGSKKP